jgi:hypothetical protein
MGIDTEQTGRGVGGGGQIKRQDVNSSVKPRNFATYKRQIMCQKVSGECQQEVTTDFRMLAVSGMGVHMVLTVHPPSLKLWRESSAAAIMIRYPSGTRPR